MGTNSTNTFTAMTGSTVSAAGGNNALMLQQAAGGPATGAIAVNNYINFNHLDVTSGAWTTSGASTAQDATLSGGVALIGNNASLGTGTITGNGGAGERANMAVRRRGSSTNVDRSRRDCCCVARPSPPRPP